MNNQSILLFVEGREDRQILDYIFFAADIPRDRIEIVPMQGKGRIIAHLRQIQSRIPNPPNPIAVLVDSDTHSVPDAKADFEEKLGQKLDLLNAKVFFAVPEIEAWLFADRTTAMGQIEKKGHRIILEALPRPEDIIEPRQLARECFGQDYSFLKDMDVEQAEVRSFSLRVFLTGIREMLSNKREMLSNKTEANELKKITGKMNLEFVSSLVSEVIPTETIIWKTMDGEKLTAREIQHEIEAGTEIGLQYASDIFRVARNFLKTMANSGDSE